LIEKGVICKLASDCHLTSNHSVLVIEANSRALAVENWSSTNTSYYCVKCDWVCLSCIGL